LDQSLGLLALVKPKVVVMAHTGTSHTLGIPAERELVARVETKYGFCFVTAFGSVIAALNHLGIKRVALGTPLLAFNDFRRLGGFRNKCLLSTRINPKGASLLLAPNQTGRLDAETILHARLPQPCLDRRSGYRSAQGLG
jgi:hypothetical protein